MKLPASEYDIHCGVAALLRAASAPCVLWSHFPAGENRDLITGWRLKRMGLKRGWADFIVIAPGDYRNFRSMTVGFLEIKSARGKLTPEQKAFQLACEAVGARYAIARSITEAEAILRGWGALRVTVGARRAAA